MVMTFCRCRLQLCDQLKENCKYFTFAETERLRHVWEFSLVPSKLTIFCIVVFTFVCCCLGFVLFVAGVSVIVVCCWLSVVGCRVLTVTLLIVGCRCL
jgi:hypothetical protein